MLLCLFGLYLNHFLPSYVNCGNENGSLRMFLGNKRILGCSSSRSRSRNLLEMCSVLCFLWTFVVYLFLYPRDAGRFFCLHGTILPRQSFIGRLKCDAVYTTGFGMDSRSLKLIGFCSMLDFLWTYVVISSSYSRDASRFLNIDRTILTQHLFFGSTASSDVSENFGSRSSWEYHRPKIKLDFKKFFKFL